jgi:hypothetical protein
MMISPRLTECKQCSEILPLLEEIDCAMFKMSKSMYNNMILMLGIPINHAAMLSLLHYKRILTYKYFNASYVSGYSVNQIASKVKLLKYK